MPTLTVAWRNIWRNKRRTVITVIAITLNTAVLIATFALIEGMLRQLENNITQLAVGHAQVHAEDYLEDRSLYEAVGEPEAILAAAEKAGIDAAPRSYGYGLVAQGSKSAGASFWGVDPGAEGSAFQLPTRVKEGSFLGARPAQGMVLGSKLARSLHAKVGSEIVALVQAADGSLGNELYTVVGILRASGDDIDRGAALIHRADFDRLFAAEGRVHEIALNTRNAMPLEAIPAALGPLGDGNELKSWRQLIPAMARMLEMSQGSTFLMALIFYLAAGFGVLNTMLMATHDRVNEYGVQKALGATPWRIIKDVSAEGWMLALVSTVIGAGLGILGGLYLQHYGIDFGETGELSISGIAYDSVMRGILTTADVINCVITMWIICVLASLYPAVKAARLRPVDAINHV